MDDFNRDRLTNGWMKRAHDEVDIVKKIEEPYLSQVWPT
jgi:hypothetical protein